MQNMCSIPVTCPANKKNANNMGLHRFYNSTCLFLIKVSKPDKFMYLWYSHVLELEGHEFTVGFDKKPVERFERNNQKKLRIFTF